MSKIGYDTMNTPSATENVDSTEKYRKAMEALQSQITRIKSENDELKRNTEQYSKIRDEHEELKKKKSELDLQNERLQRFYETVVDDRRKKYEKIKSTEIDPYLADISKVDTGIASHISSLDNSIRDVVKDGVIDPAGENQLVVLQACASIQKHTSSSLQNALKSEREWAQKYETVTSKLSETEKKNNDMMKELEELKNKLNSSINNTSTHFIQPPAIPSSNVVEAVAGDQSTERDFTTLFARKPTADWRSMFPEPPPYRK